MATVTLLPKLDGGSSPWNVGGGSSVMAANGTTDKGDAVRVQDAKYLSATGDQATNNCGFLFDDTGALPATVTISQVVFNVRHKSAVHGNNETDPTLQWNTSGTINQNTFTWDAPNAAGALTSTAYTTWTVTTTVDPSTGVAWTRAGLLGTKGPTLTAFFNASAAGMSNEYDVDLLSATVTYTVPWWQLLLATMTLYFSGAQPSDYMLPFDIFSGGVFYPAGTSIAWVTASEPTDKGWWVSSDAFAGVGYVVDSTSRPKAPRGFTELVAFATGANLWACGTPSATFNNHLVYAEGGYTVGTTSPVIRIYDGLTDRPIASIPNTAAGAVPKAITAMLTANGVVYIATLDSGSSSADWVGRIFALDIESGQLTPMGSALTIGHIPYTLCWHAGRLWCGTHRQSTAASGKVFYLRPGIDTDWTADYDLATSTVSSVTSLLSFQGKLYIGTNNAAAAFAKILVRDTAGTYSTSLTLSGGAATAGNGVPALVEFSGALYASFYNADAPVIASIRKYDGSSWTTAYSGSGTTLVPFIGFPTDGTKLLAIAGGVGIAAVVLKTTDGTSWTDQSTFLQQTTTSSAGLSAFGTLVH